MSNKYKTVKYVKSFCDTATTYMFCGLSNNKLSAPSVNLTKILPKIGIRKETNTYLGLKFCLIPDYKYPKTGNYEDTVSILDHLNYAKPPEKDPGAVKEAGGRLGKLDAAGEEGFFHKTNQSRLEKLKRRLKEEGLTKETPDPASKTES